MSSQKSQNPKKTTFLEPNTGLQRDRQRRVLDAISLKRRNPELSLSAAARRSGTTVKTIRTYAGAALYTRSGRLDVHGTDRIPREMLFLTPQGYVALHVTNSRDASRIAKYHNALRRYLLRRDPRELQQFTGKTIRVAGTAHPFLTDAATINRLVRAGAVSFLDIYGSPGGL
jgi:hypothetical protein